MQIEKIKKLVTNLHCNSEHVIHVRNLKRALNSGLVLKKFNRMIKFNQNTWLKQYIDMNSKLRKKAKVILRKTDEQCSFYKNYEKC